MIGYDDALSLVNLQEDYESDFEEAMSSQAESEDEPEPSKQNAVGIVGEQEDIEETPVEDEDNDKSSSIREFEQLEKLVESEEEKKLKNSNGQFGNLKEDTRGGAGEPASTGGIITIPRPVLDEKSEEEEDDEEEDSVAPSSPVERKQNAFPQTKGFSIASSMPQNNDQFGGNRERKSALAARRSTVKGSGEMLKTSSQGPLGESNVQMVSEVIRVTGIK